MGKMKKKSRTALYVMSTGIVMLLLAPVKAQAMVTDVQEGIKEAARIRQDRTIKGLYPHHYNWQTPNTSNVKISNPSVKLDGTPAFEPGEVMYSGQDEFVNNTNREQTLYTPEFKYVTTESTTTTVTEGMATGFKFSVDFKVKIPFVETNHTIEVSGEYTLDETKTNTSIETIEHTAPSQMIKIKPGETIKVTAFFQKAKVYGNTILSADVAGMIGYISDYDGANGRPVTYTYWDYFGNALYSAKSSAHSAKFQNWILGNNGPASVTGKGTFSKDVGTNFELVVETVNNKGQKDDPKSQTIKVNSNRRVIEE